MTLWSRARRGLRRDRGLYLVTTFSLAIALFAVGIAGAFYVNAGKIAERWDRGPRLSVFLREGVNADKQSKFAKALSETPFVRDVRLLSAEKAASEVFGETTAVGAEFFPETVEVEFDSDATVADIRAIHERVESMAFVESVADYQSWNEQLAALTTSIRQVALFAIFIVAFGGFFLILNTIRLSISSRREEIEVQRLCGATSRFIAGPFVVEAALQACIAALAAMLALFLTERFGAASVFSFLSGALSIDFQIVSAPMLLLLPLFALAISTLASLLCVRRCLEV